MSRILVAQGLYRMIRHYHCEMIKLLDIWTIFLGFYNILRLR